MLLGTIFIIFMLLVLFKVAGLLFHVAGAVLGFFLGMVFYLILGVIAVSLLGFAIFVLPGILIAGVASLLAVFHLVK